MKQVELRKQLAKARAGLYRFLGGLYIMEVDAQTLANMKQMQFPTDCENRCWLQLMRVWQRPQQI